MFGRFRGYGAQGRPQGGWPLYLIGPNDCRDSDGTLRVGLQRRVAGCNSNIHYKETTHVSSLGK